MTKKTWRDYPRAAPTKEQRIAINLRVKDRYHLLRANGLCIRCKQTALPDRAYCRLCRLNQSSYEAECRRRKGVKHGGRGGEWEKMREREGEKERGMGRIQDPPLSLSALSGMPLT